MTALPSRRPWWKRKRTWAAVAACLLLWYPASVGPYRWLGQRRMLPSGTRRVVDLLYEPIRVVVYPTGFPPARYGFGWYDRYLNLFNRPPKPTAP